MSSPASAIGFVEARSRAPRVHITDVSGKGLHLGDRVVFAKVEVGGKTGLSIGRVAALSPTLATVVEEDGSGYRLNRIPCQVSRID